MYVLVFQNSDGIQNVWTLNTILIDGDEHIAEADKIVRDYVNEHCPDVDVDFEEGNGTEKGGMWIATWAIGAEGEYFELWRESTVH